MNRTTEAEIREALLDHYTGHLDRDLVKNVRPDGHGDTPGSVVYSIPGSPPKGYAIAIPELREVSLYDYQGKRIRHMSETVVEELEDVDRV